MPSLNDNTLLTANDLGVLSGAIDINDSFDASDRIAYYRFTLAQNSDLAGLFSEATSLTSVRVISDRNANGIVENNEIVARTAGSPFTGGSNSFFQPLPAGTYFIEVFTELSRTEPYRLRLTETSKPGNVFPDPGNSLAQALDLGTLSGQRSLRDYVGALDEIDFYKFTLAQNSNLGIVASGQTSDTRVQIISDRNANGIVDSGEVIEGFNFGFSNNDSFSATLSAGTYFILVGRNVSSANSTQYDLAITVAATASPNPPNPENNPPATDDLGVPLPRINFRRGIRGDRLRGSNERDRLRGSNGNDILTGRGGNDVLLGGRGNDRLRGSGGNDRLQGGNNDDLLIGGSERDRLLGQQGNDVLIGGTGNDLLIGGSGADTFVYQSLNDGVDTIRQFEVGSDRFDLSRIFASGAFAGGTNFQRFTRFVELRAVGGSTEVRIDIDGNGARTDTVALAVVQGVTGLTSRNFIVG